MLSEIRPNSLHDRLKNDLEFSHHHLRKDFQKFVLLAIKLAEAFQLVDDGKPKAGGSDQKPTGTFNNSVNHISGGYTVVNSRNKLSHNTAGPNTKTKVTTIKPGRKPPLCIMPSCRANQLRHYFDDCIEPKEAVEEMKRSLDKPPSSGAR